MKPEIVAAIICIVAVVFTSVFLGVVLGYNPKPSKSVPSSLAQIAPAPAYHRRKIPRIIWSYWNNDVIPEFVKQCIKTWTIHNPDFQVHVITPSTISHFIPEINVKAIPSNDSPAHESDIVRVCVLEKFGGVWSDATIILYAPYEFANVMDDYDFVGYYLNYFTTDERYPVIENWWFATPANGTYISALKRACLDFDAPHDTKQKRLQYFLDNGVDMQRIGDTSYLYQHVCGQFVLQKQLGQDFIKKRMLLREAEKGPLAYLCDVNWDAQRAIDGLKGDHTYKFVKLRSHERACAEKEDPKSLFN